MFVWKRKLKLNESNVGEFEFEWALELQNKTADKYGSCCCLRTLVAP